MCPDTGIERSTGTPCADQAGNAMPPTDARSFFFPLLTCILWFLFLCSIKCAGCYVQVYASVFKSFRNDYLPCCFKPHGNSILLGESGTVTKHPKLDRKNQNMQSTRGKKGGGCDTSRFGTKKWHALMLTDGCDVFQYVGCKKVMRFRKSGTVAAATVWNLGAWQTHEAMKRNTHCRLSCNKTKHKKLHGKHPFCPPSWCSRNN